MPRIIYQLHCDNCVLIPIRFLDAQNSSKETSENILRQINKDTLY